MITTNQINWVAGLLEGEGSFTFPETPTIQMISTDLDTIQKFKSITNTPSSTNVFTPKNSKHKVQYRTNIGSSLAIQWMMTIYPLMSLRRKEQIKEIINKWHLMRGLKGCRHRPQEVVDHEKLIKMLSHVNKISFNEAEVLWEKIKNPIETEKLL